MIPDEAVEAAAKRLAMDDGWPDDWKRCRSQAKSALEAAAPHLKAGALRDAAADTRVRGDIGKDGGIEAWIYLDWRADRLANE